MQKYKLDEKVQIGDGKVEIGMKKCKLRGKVQIGDVITRQQSQHQSYVAAREVLAIEKRTSLVFGFSL